MNDAMDTSRARASGNLWEALGRSPAVAAVGFALLATVSFVLLREPPILSDQLDYFSAAWALPDTTPTHRHLRVGLIWPVWALTRLFGYSEAAYYGIPLLTRFLLGFATWWLGKQMFSARVGWVAGILLMLTPGYSRVTSQLLPDYFAAAMITLSMALIFWACSGKQRATRKNVLALLAAGACVGWAYLCREYIVILFPCIGLAMLLLRASPKGWFSFATGAVLVYSLELLWGWLVYDNPFIRFSASASPRTTEREFATEVHEVLLLLPEAFSTYGGWWLPVFVAFGLLAPLIALRLRHTGWRVLAAWSLPGWVFFTAIALLPILVFDERAVYLRLHMFRYWSIIFPPIFIAGVAAVFLLHDAIRRRCPRWAAAGFATLLLAVPVIGTIVGLQQVTQANSLVRATGGDYEEFRRFIQAHTPSPSVLWMDHASGVASSNSLPVYLHSPMGKSKAWDGEIRYLNSSRSNWIDEDLITEGYVALDRTRSGVIYNRATPDYFLSPGTTWKTIFRSSHGRIIVLDPSSPPPVTSYHVRVPASSLQVRRTGSDAGDFSSVMTDDEMLDLKVAGDTRIVVVDDAANGVAPPPDGENLIPEGAGHMSGTILLNAASGSPDPAVRCLFYDRHGKRTAPWANVSGGIPQDNGSMRAFNFSCPLPGDRALAASSRVLVQFTKGTDVRIDSIEYGFTPD